MYWKAGKSRWERDESLHSETSGPGAMNMKWVGGVSSRKPAEPVWER